METVGLKDQQCFDNRSVTVKRVTESKKLKCRHGEGETPSLATEEVKGQQTHRAATTTKSNFPR